MSESDEDAPWRIGPPPPPASGPESGPRPPAGPPPPRTIQSWMGLSHAYSQAVAGVLNTHYASHFRGTILPYLPPELQTPYVGLRDIVVSIRPLRPHERDHPLILHIQDDEEAHETMEGADEETDTATGSGGADGSVNANLHHVSSINPDETAAEGTDETDEGPAYYYEDTMMPISGDEGAAPHSTTGRSPGSGRGSAPTNKAKAKAKSSRRQTPD
ncbi:unnamed protein product [Symbiodinium necroappetens]|uniref:Uncharacterized protein n=1 Tax=Symbiodinium necroappetens TaxID=1628268 RepID=A0A813A8C8_9DINO|nr:unnamed protein product [Symbiodinium necroappetens]